MLESSEIRSSYESSSVSGSWVGGNDCSRLVEYLVRNRWMEFDLGEELEEYSGKSTWRRGCQEVADSGVLRFGRDWRNLGESGGRRGFLSD